MRFRSSNQFTQSGDKFISIRIFMRFAAALLFLRYARQHSSEPVGYRLSPDKDKASERSCGARTHLRYRLRRKGIS